MSCSIGPSVVDPAVLGSVPLPPPPSPVLVAVPVVVPFGSGGGVPDWHEDRESEPDEHDGNARSAVLADEKVWISALISGHGIEFTLLHKLEGFLHSVLGNKINYS